MDGLKFDRLEFRSNRGAQARMSTVIPLSGAEIGEEPDLARRRDLAADRIFGPSLEVGLGGRPGSAARLRRQSSGISARIRCSSNDNLSLLDGSGNAEAGFARHSAEVE